MRSLICCVLVSLSSCTYWEPSPDHHYNLWIDDKFSDAQANDITVAATEWQKLSNDFITFNGFSSSPDAPDTIAIYAVDGFQLNRDCGGDSVLGCQWDEGVNSKIYADASLSGDSFLQMVRHEMGHALGLAHTAPNTIMCADNSCASLTIQCADIQQLCSVWHNECVAETMPVCRSK